MRISLFVWLIFIGLMGFAGFTRWQNLSEAPLIETDGQGYYAYLPAVFLYQDLQFSFIDELNEAYYPTDKRAKFVIGTDNGNVNKYFAGTAIIQAPFFGVACAISPLFNAPIDGYSWPFQLMIGIAAIVSTCQGLFFLARLLQELGFKVRVVLLTLVVLLFGTNLFYYTVYEPSMSHAYTFLTISAFLYFIRRSYSELTAKRLLLAALFLGLTALIRPTNALIVLVIPALTNGLFGTVNFLERVFVNPKTLALSALIALVVVSMQPMIYLLQTGRPMVWSYEGEGFNFLSPEIFNVLFSYRKGLFVYCPVLFISLIGIASGLVRNKPQYGWLLAVLSAFIWMIASWWMWYYGGSYGHRAFIDIYPLIAIGMAAAFQFGLGALRPWLLVLVAIALIPLQLVQTYQYVHHIIPFDNMSKEKFWNLFLRTGEDLHWYYSGYEGQDTYVAMDSVLIRNGMEENWGWGNEQQITDSTAFAGGRSARMNLTDTYGITLRRTANELAGKYNVIRISGQIMPSSNKTDLSFVCSIEDSTGANYYWSKHPLRPQFNGTGTWSWTTALFKCGPIRHPSDRVVIYPMKTDNSVVHLDEFEISFIEAR